MFADNSGYGNKELTFYLHELHRQTSYIKLAIRYQVTIPEKPVSGQSPLRVRF